jgi:hypothetical protein
MTEKKEVITLYEHRNDRITVEVKAILSDNGLTVSGYDSGKYVKDHFDSFDYEYNLTVKAADLPALYTALGLNNPETGAFLAHLKTHYGHGTGFSALMDLLKKQNIKHDTFFWH